MSRRASGRLLLLTVATSACFGRGGQGAAPAPAVVPPVKTDTAPTPVRSDSIIRSVPSAEFLGQTAKPPTAGAPAAAAKPAERCIMDLENTPETRSQSVLDPNTGKYFTYLGGGVFGKCRGQDITLQADSAESYDQSQLYILIGNAKYKEPRVTINSQRATYFRSEERVLMEGDVKAVMKSGATMVGPKAEYFRAVRGIRTSPKLVAQGRPQLTFVETDSAGKAQPPTKLVAQEIIAEGDSIFIGHGRVILDRSDVVATGDSAYLNNNKQFSRLLKNPKIESKGSQPFTLTGTIIDLYGSARMLDRIVSIDSARATSKDLLLVSDTLDLRMQENKLQRAFAFGPGGARATTPERDITADSLDVVMPNQRIRELRAIRRAYAESDPDSTKVVSDERDWLRGDTIIARFDSLAASDTTSKPQVKDILASGTASSYYQVPSNSGDKNKPGINYVRGRQIHIDFTKGEVQTVTVSDSVSGVYLEAASDTTANQPGKGRRARPASRNAPAVRRPPAGELP